MPSRSPPSYAAVPAFVLHAAVFSLHPEARTIGRHRCHPELRRDKSSWSNLSRNHFVHITPHPRLARLDRSHQGVFRGMEMFGRVFVLRRIATPHMSALQAHPQMHPSVAHLHALLANVNFRRGEFDLTQMPAWFRHRCPPLRAQDAPAPFPSRVHRTRRQKSPARIPRPGLPATTFCASGSLAARSRLTRGSSAGRFLASPDGAARFLPHRVHQRHLHQVLAQEPHLHLVGTRKIPHQQIVGSVIAQIVGLLRQLPRVFDDAPPAAAKSGLALLPFPSAAVPDASVQPHRGPSPRSRPPRL